MSSESQLPGFSDFASKVGRSPSLWPPGKAELGPGCMVESWGGGRGTAVQWGDLGEVT